MNKRVKRFFVFLLFAVPILYFLFTLLFFSPFEESFGKVEYVIPREVDFFVAKAGLDQDITDFPTPDFYRDLEVNHEWRVFKETDMFRELMGGFDIDRMLDEVRTNMQEVPIDPIKDVLGQEIAVIGTMTEGGAKPFTFLSFARVSTKIKLAYELFLWDMVRGMTGDPMIADSSLLADPAGYHTLSLSDGQEFFLRRELDLLIFGNDEHLMQEVCSLISAESASIDLSLGGTSAYAKEIASLEELETGHIDFHLNLERIFRLAEFDDHWRENEVDFSVMTALQIFDPSYFKCATGALTGNEYLDLNANVDFYTEQVREAETGFFNMDSIPIKSKMDFLTGMLPQDVYLAGCINIDVERVLKMMETNLDPDLRRLITDLIREGRRFNTKWDVMETWHLIEKLAKTFGNVVSFALRPRDVDKPLIPGVQPVPIIALVLEIRDMTQLMNMEKTLIELQTSNRHNFEMWKYKNQIANCTIKGITTPGADDIEQVAYTILDDRYFIFATSAKFVEDMLNAKMSPNSSLKSSTEYQPAAQFIGSHGNMACYLKTDGLKWALHNYAVYWAEINSFIDFTEERARARKRIIQSEYPKYARQPKLPTNIENKVVSLVDAEMDELARRREDDEIPRLTQEFRDNLVWFDLLDSFVLTVNVNVNDFDIGLRLESVLTR